MCMLVFIGADRELERVPWDPERPAFRVEDLEAGHRGVRRHFEGKHVYAVGSHTHCACGFQYGQNPDLESDEEQRVLARQARRDFADYLAGQLAESDEVTLWACWDGDQDADVERQRTLTPDDIDTEGFAFLERELSVVRRSASGEA